MKTKILILTLAFSVLSAVFAPQAFAQQEGADTLTQPVDSVRETEQESVQEEVSFQEIWQNPPSDTEGILAILNSDFALNETQRLFLESLILDNYLRSGPVHITHAIVDRAVEWAQSKIGDAQADAYWNGYCLAFVRTALEQGGVPKQGSYASGPEAAATLEAAGLLHKDQNPPRGTLVMFGAKAGYGPYGHAALSLGDGKVIHNYAKKIRIDNLSTIIGHGYPYLGWAVWKAELGNTMEGVSGRLPASEFVTRNYELFFGRASTDDDTAYWTDYLKRSSAAQMLDFFADSAEFQAKQYDDAQAVSIFYNALMDRPADAEGLYYHTELLRQGVSRRYVLSLFVGSAEFKEVCAQYGVVPGVLTSTEWRDKNPQLTAYIARLYNIMLGRSHDPDGLNYWAKLLVQKTETPRGIARRFASSDEFIARALDDNAYVTVLYQTTMNRAPDAQGLAYWTQTLAKGKTRDFVLDSFLTSQEFAEIIQDYGL